MDYASRRRERASGRTASWARLLEPRRATLLVGCASAALVLAALGLQYLGGFEPCNLCIWQRYPHVAVFFLGLIGAAWRPRLMLGLIVLALIGNAALAGYHVGIEQGWWPLPESCTVGQGATSIEELRQMLANAPPRCDEVSFTFLGLSLTVWNALACLGLAAVAAFAAARSRERAARIAAPAG